MAICPHCATSLIGDFGMTTCPGCHAMVLLDANGQVVEPSQDQYFESAEPTSQQGASQVFAYPESEAEQELEFQGQSDQDALVESEPGFETEPASESQLQAFDDFYPDEPGENFQVPTSYAGTEGVESLQDIADFGNSSESGARDGILYFDLRISGVDVEELRRLLREALEDQRFLLDVEGIMKSIQSGALVIQGLSAVKTSLLVQKLLPLGFDLSWEQHSIHEP